MVYCTVADINSMFFSITFDGTTKITDTEVEDFIINKSHLIDSLIGYRYNLPVTGDRSLAVLKIVCQYLVSGDIFSIMERSTGKAFKIDDVAYDQMKFQQGKALMKGIKNNSVVLSTEDLLTTPSETYVPKNFNDTTPFYDEDSIYFCPWSTTFIPF